MNKTTIALVALAFVVGLVAYTVTGMMIMKAYGEEMAERKIVLFLLENACGQADKLAEQFTDAYVYCTHDSTVMLARSHLAGFEAMYHVVYVDNNQSWGITKEYVYAIARPWNVEIRHELEHLECKCFYTADGLHGSPQSGTKSGVIVG